MKQKKIEVRARLVIIKKGKILLSYSQDHDFYFFTGGHMEFGETLVQTCEREVLEETGAKFTFKKILYVRDFILPEENEHSVEFYVLGDVDKFKEIDMVKDTQHAGRHWQTWVDLKDLKNLKIKPKSLVPILLKDFKSNFSVSTRYLGQIV